MLSKLMNLDRRIIFILVALAVIIPTLLPINLPINVSEPTQRIYDYIDALPAGSTIMISFDYGPSSLPELNPMAKAVLRHCFDKDVRVIGMTLYPFAPTLADTLITEVAEEAGAVNGEDYVFLGFRPGGEQVMLRMGISIGSVFEKDYTNTPLTEISMMKNITNYDHIDLILDLASGSTTDLWITYVNVKYNQQIAAGVTGVIVSNMYPYLQTKQLVGLMPGYLGASEYEKLISVPEKGTQGINNASPVHVLILGLVVIGNIVFFIQRRREGIN